MWNTQSIADFSIVEYVNRKYYNLIGKIPISHNRHFDLKSWKSQIMKTLRNKQLFSQFQDCSLERNH